MQFSIGPDYSHVSGELQPIRGARFLTGKQAHSRRPELFFCELGWAVDSFFTHVTSVNNRLQQLWYLWALLAIVWLIISICRLSIGLNWLIHSLELTLFLVN